MTKTWHVYEVDNDGDESFIGEVEAETYIDAEEKAVDEYGSPIRVHGGYQ